MPPEFHPDLLGLIQAFTISVILWGFLPPPQSVDVNQAGTQISIMPLQTAGTRKDPCQLVDLWYSVHLHVAVVFSLEMCCTESMPLV